MKSNDLHNLPALEIFYNLSAIALTESWRTADNNNTLIEHAGAAGLNEAP